MTFEVLEIWLKTSVLGIVILGALGSTIAVIGWKVFQYTITKIIPIPYLAHRTRGLRRAYTLGYAAATFEHDEKGHASTIFMAFRLARLIISLFTFVSLLIIFSIVLALSGEIIVTFGIFIVITMSLKHISEPTRQAEMS
jgi:hypothetical protein